MPRTSFHKSKNSVSQTTTSLSVRLPLRTVELLKQFAEVEGITHGEYLRCLVNEHVYRLQGLKKSEKDIKQVVDFAKLAVDEVTKLKDKVNELERVIAIIKIEKGL